MVVPVLVPRHQRPGVVRPPPPPLCLVCGDPPRSMCLPLPPPATFLPDPQYLTPLEPLSQSGRRPRRTPRGRRRAPPAPPPPPPSAVEA